MLATLDGSLRRICGLAVLGSWAVDFDGDETWTPAGVDCPYCLTEMVAYVGRAAVHRVVKIVGPRDDDGYVTALVLKMPRGYVLLACESCESRLTLPPQV
jgi:hypothetical protein